MEWLNKDLRRYGTRGMTLVGALSLAATVLLGTAVIEIFSVNNERLLVWMLLAMTLAITSARHPVEILGTDTAISVSEALIFLTVMTLGPYHGAVLGGIDMLLVSRRLHARPTVYLLNISNITISTLVAGKVYYSITSYLGSQDLSVSGGQAILVFALPIIAMAVIDYVLQFSILAAFTYLTQLIKISERVRSTWPWEPVTYMAGATVAGLINYVFHQHGYITTIVTMVLILPVLIIIYYTFRTYHDKLGEQQQHNQELTNIYDSILEMLAMAIDAKDDVTHDHIQRVKLFARRMGEIVGLAEREIEALKAGALLHDIGKIGVPAYILNKPGKLTEHEFEQMKMHTIIGADMLSNIDFRYPVVPIVRHHHERWDGRGYPDGLKGDEIPITARILTLVDTYDALRSDRPYKKAMTREETLAILKSNSGTFYDPSLVEIFLSVVDQLEAEAANFQSSHKKQVQVASAAMTNARPAAGLETAPPVDRATAALNSIAETNQRVTALYEMSRTLSSILPVEDTVAILANRLSKLIPFTTCAISLFDPTHSEFEVIHAVGRHAEKLMRRRQPAEAGITGYVITNQRPMYNTNPLLDLGFLGTEAASEYKAVIVFPLVKNQEALGAVALYSTELENYGSEHIQLSESVAQPASDAVYNALAFEQAQRAALTDPITGLANLRSLTNQFDRERARSHRLGTPLSLLVVTVNNLEEFAASTKSSTEQALLSFSKLLKQQVRETDLIARQSANSFIALLPDSGQAEASEVRQRLHDAIASASYAQTLSISTGSATSPGDGNSFEDLLQAAQIECMARCEGITDMVLSSIKDQTVVDTL